LQLEGEKEGDRKRDRQCAERQARYKSQQLQVRKNDEYQALGSRLRHTQSEIETLEEEELR